MAHFRDLPFAFQQSFSNHSHLKVIAGLANFDLNSVIRIARASAQGGADSIDVACDPKLVRRAYEESRLPICVSSVQPQLFPEAVEAGASMVEIGNFDSFYPQGRFFNADEVLSLTRETRSLLPNVFLSVTVPHILPLNQQADLAVSLVQEGVDVIQTEGGTSSRPNSSGSLGLIEKASPTLAALYSIANRFDEIDCKVPIICASGLSEVTIPMALSIGASGIGVGSAINRLENEIEMIAMVRRLRNAFSLNKCTVKNMT